MNLLETIRNQIADSVVRIFAPSVIIAMVLNIFAIWLFGQHQYHRMIPALAVIVVAVPGWLLAMKGRPLFGYMFVIACMCLVSSAA